MLSFILLTSTLVQPVTKCGYGVPHQHPPTTMESLHKVVKCNTENSLEQTFFVKYTTQRYGVRWSIDLTTAQAFQRERQRARERERWLGSFHRLNCPRTIRNSWTQSTNFNFQIQSWREGHLTFNKDLIMKSSYCYPQWMNHISGKEWQC